MCAKQILVQRRESNVFIFAHSAIECDAIHRDNIFNSRCQCLKLERNVDCLGEPLQYEIVDENKPAELN